MHACLHDTVGLRNIVVVAWVLFVVGAGGSFGKRLESKETSSSSNWASVHNTLHLVDATATNEVAFMTKNSLALRDTHSSKEAQTMPFKSIQSPSSMMDQKSSSAAESENWKKRTGASTGMIVSAAGSQASTQQQPQPQPGSVLNGSGSIFSFNSTHSARGTADAAAAAAAAAEGYDYDSKFEKDSSSASFDFNRASGAHRAATAAVGPLLKPTPSKWDDAQKWLSASDQAPGNATAKPISKCKSGPMQQQQGGGGATTVSTKKVTFSNLSAAGRQSATANGGGGAATTHFSKPTNAVAENCGGRDAPSSSAPSVELIEGGVAAAAGTAMSRGGGAVDRYPLNDLYEGSSSRSSPDASDKSLKPARLRTAKPTSESATEGGSLSSLSLLSLASVLLFPFFLLDFNWVGGWMDRSRIFVSEIRERLGSVCCRSLNAETLSNRLG